MTETTAILLRSAALFLRIAQVGALAFAGVLFIGGFLAGFTVIEFAFILFVGLFLFGAAILVEFIGVRPLRRRAGGEA